MAERKPAHREHWRDDVIALAIIPVGLLAPAPLSHRHYAIAGAIVFAIIVRVALAVSHHSGLSQMLPPRHGSTSSEL